MRLLVILTVVLSVFLNLQNIPGRFNYGWDQRRDAKVLEEIVDGHKLTLVGPRAVSDTGFLLGPMHYYLLVPFYLATHDTQLAEIYLACVVSVLTCIATIFVGTKMFGQRTAILSGLVTAAMPATVSWNPMYMPVLALIMVYCCFQIINRDYRFVVLAFGVVGIAFQAHFSAVFLAVYLAGAIFFSKSDRRVTKYVVYGVGLLALSFLPLIFFDLRHNFINIKAFSNFFFGGQGSLGINFQSFTVFLRSQNLVAFIASVIGIFWMPRKFRALMAMWILAPVLLFTLYKGGISEYYFSVVSPVVLLLGVDTAFNVLKRLI